MLSAHKIHYSYGPSRSSRLLAFRLQRAKYVRGYQLIRIIQSAMPAAADASSGLKRFNGKSVADLKDWLVGTLPFAISLCCSRFERKSLIAPQLL